MRMVLIGASQLAMATVRALLDERHEAVVIEKDAAVIEQLDKEYDCSFLCGDGAKPSVLQEIDPESTDALLCLTDNDTSNVLSAVVAMTMKFERVILRLEDPDLLSICKHLGLENVIVPDLRVAKELVAFAEASEKSKE